MQVISPQVGPLPTLALSVIVITRNEAHQLAKCLESVAFAGEIVVIDSGSTDGTQSLAASLGARGPSASSIS